jgi:hypothetical protein
MWCLHVCVCACIFHLYTYIILFLYSTTHCVDIHFRDVRTSLLVSSPRYYAHMIMFLYTCSFKYLHICIYICICIYCGYIDISIYIYISTWFIYMYIYMNMVTAPLGTPNVCTYKVLCIYICKSVKTSELLLSQTNLPGAKLGKRWLNLRSSTSTLNQTGLLKLLNYDIYIYSITQRLRSSSCEQQVQRWWKQSWILTQSTT